MSRTWALPLALLFFASACAPHRPQLKARAALGPDAPAETVVDAVALAGGNYFALQRYFQAPKSLLRRPPPDAERSWATEAVKAESQALAALLPRMESIVAGPISPRRDRLVPVQYVSYTLFFLEPEEVARVWETARLRVNLGAYLATLYWDLAVVGADAPSIPKLREDVARAREDLAKLSK